MPDEKFSTASKHTQQNKKEWKTPVLTAIETKRTWAKGNQNTEFTYPPPPDGNGAIFGPS